MTASVLKACHVNLICDLPALGAGPGDAGQTAQAARQAELDEAHRSGIAEGVRIAAEEGVAAVPRLIDSIVESAAAVRRSAVESAAAPVADVALTAFEVARWIIGREVTTDVSILTSRVEAVMEDLLPTGPVVVEVAPSIVDALQPWSERADVTVRADDTLAPGEARVDAGHASAEMTFAQARVRLIEALAIEDGLSDPSEGRGDQIDEPHIEEAEGG